MLIQCSPQIGATYNPDLPYPADSLLLLRTRRNAIVFSKKRTFFAIVFAFLKHCKSLHSCLERGEGGCKLAMMPGLLFSWKDGGTTAVSFFLDNELPHTWLIPIKKEKGDWVFGPPEDAPTPPCIVLRPITRPLLDPHHVKTVWHSPDNRMAVAYTAVEDGVLYLLLRPAWIIVEDHPTWVGKIVNTVPPSSSPSYSLGETFMVVVASENEIAIFNKEDTRYEELPPYPMWDLAQHSLMWYVALLALKNQTKIKKRKG